MSRKPRNLVPEAIMPGSYADTGDIDLLTGIPTSKMESHFMLGSDSPWEIANDWLKIDSKSLSSDNLLNHFRLLVPYIYAPRADCNCLAIKYDEEEELLRIIEPLDRFLSNNENPDKFFESLAVIDKPESFCGHVFVLGEPTYACRDCGLDPTCVLCVECFKVSPHRHHRYKISNSAGGGYCDCGDAEAWKKDVYCEIHAARLSDTKPKCMPKDVQDRALRLFDILIPYCFDRLTEPFRVQLPDNLIVHDFEMDILHMSGLLEVYCTILYNDESHTFDNVIQTLTRALGCSKKDAIEFASFIDRQGRSILKCSTFTECNKVCEMIDRYSTRNGGRALAVSVAPVLTVAHQLFAIRLLSWVQKIVAQASGYREAFCTVMLTRRESVPTITILEGLMSNDTSIWKSARSVWHNLFATGLLKDYATKKKFAEMFTKHYVEMMKDFIQDDHDHSFSVTSLSVQIFTVPTIARHLIENCDAFYSVLRSFITECELRRGQSGSMKLEFERGATAGPFRRTSYTTLDLKYLLTCPPPREEWTELLKRHFLHGFNELVRLFGWMQEMDAAVRQTGAHMEYEAEWETAFNIFIKLAPVVSLVVEWCSVKKSLLVRAYRTLLHELGKLYSFELSEKKKKEFANNSAYCYEYDVSSQPASIHLPVTRLWAALHLQLISYDLDYHSSEFDLIEGRPTPEMLIEPLFRAQVFASQVAAGMWKRNGYSITNQLFFYKNVRCRNNMFDKDLMALQIGAVLIESNAFLIHALNRFNLFTFINDSTYDTLNAPENEQVRQLCLLLEEFLALIICIVSARFIPGVGMVSELDCIRKEIIQLLCVKPMTHSVLNKSMVEDVNYETGMEQVIGDVATPKKQSGGLLYGLKPELYSEYDVFFYHYTREQMSFAENRQLMLKKEKNELEFFPPPKLPLFAPSFQAVVNIMNSDVLLKILAVVLRRSKFKQTTCSDSQLRRAFHLIGYALNEERLQSELKMENPFQFCEAATRWNIFELLEVCVNDASLSQHHHMIRWILNQHSLIKLNVPIAEGSLDGSAGRSAEDEEKLRKKRLATEAKQKMLARMSAAQNEFRSTNPDLFCEDELVVEGPQPDVVPEISVALGPNQSPRISSNELYTCILCQESQTLNETSGLTLPIFVQRSTVLCQERTQLTSAWKKKLDNKYMWSKNALFLHPDLSLAPHISCCGHVMHSACWQRHFETVLIKERRRPYRLRHLLTFDVEKNEYLCPMCQCLCNAIMPMVASSDDYFSPLQVPAQVHDMKDLDQLPTYDEWYTMCYDITQKAGRMVESYLPTDDTFREYCTDKANKFEFPESHPDINFWTTDPLYMFMASTSVEKRRIYNYFFPKGGRGLLRDDMMETTTLFVHAIFTAMSGRPGNDGEFRLPALTWQAIAFTITNCEVVHRDQRLPFFGKEVAVRQAATMNYTVLAGSLVSIYCQLYDTDTLYSTALVRLVALLCTSIETPDILNVDAFGLLVSLTFSLPALFLDKHHRRPLHTGSLQDYYLLKTVTIMHMVQIIVTLKAEIYFHLERADCENMKADRRRLEYPEYHKSILSKTCMTIWKKLGHSTLPKAAEIDWQRLDFDIQSGMIPYLRCCSKFYECLTGISPPKCLEAVDSSFGDLTYYLGLPTSIAAYCNIYVNVNPDSVAESLSHLLYNYRDWQIALTFVDKLKRKEKSKDLWRNSVTYPRKLPKLINLPEDYAELLNSASVFACRTCGTHECRIPTMCLICGETLCSQSYCCQYDLKGSLVGACTYHSYYCSGSIGIFLRIRECKVFFLGGRGKGCFASPPYLDEYGETDEGLRRGNPMKLCRQKYADFRRSWISNKIHDEIASNTEQITLIATEWQFL